MGGRRPGARPRRAADAQPGRRGRGAARPGRARRVRRPASGLPGSAEQRRSRFGAPVRGGRVDEAAQPHARRSHVTVGPTTTARSARGRSLIVAVLAFVAARRHRRRSIGDDDAADELGRERGAVPDADDRCPADDRGAATTAPPTAGAPRPRPQPAPTSSPATSPRDRAADDAADRRTTTTDDPATAAAATTAARRPAHERRRPGPTTPDEPEPPGIVTALVPNVAAFAEYLATPRAGPGGDRRAARQRAPRRGGAGPVATICAAVPLDPAARGRHPVGTRRARASRRASSAGATRPASASASATTATRSRTGPTSSSRSTPRQRVGGRWLRRRRRAHRPALRERRRRAGVRDPRRARASSRYFEVYVYDASPIPPGGPCSSPSPTSARTPRRWRATTTSSPTSRSTRPRPARSSLSTRPGRDPSTLAGRPRRAMSRT